jgi:Arc/MetJ-type ribon-helix-helix transcriptional regulator
MKAITAMIPDRSGLEIEYRLKIGAYHTEGEVLKDALRQLLLSRLGYRRHDICARRDRCGDNDRARIRFDLRSQRYA